MRLFFFLSLTFIITGNIVLAFSANSEQVRLELERSFLAFNKDASQPYHCIKSMYKFYCSSAFELVWTDAVMLDELLEAIKNSSLEGLNPTDYHFEKLQSLRNTNINLEQSIRKTQIELFATDAFLLYTSHLLSGKVNPQQLDAEWHVVRREGDPLISLQKAIKSRNVIKVIEENIPKHQIYKSLKKALSHYKSVQDKGGWRKVSEGITIKPGDKDDRISSIRERLIATGDVVSSSQEIKYDEDLLLAVKQFQKRYGLTDDGEIGKGTIAAMNVPVEDRIDQIIVNLERWRWLPQEFSDYYIKVNIADFTLEVIRNGKVERFHKVIVGKSYRRTPVFSSQINYLVFNPTWTVPPGILNSDVIPAVRKNVNYLKTKKLIVYDKNGNIVNPEEVDWTSTEVRSYTYRQPAGPDNALGAVKFIFPNIFNVYIHDTPSKDLFDKTERLFSSGCIRVQDPLKLAYHLVDDEGKWPMEKIEKQISSNQTITVVPRLNPHVYILYWTAWTDKSGLIQFRKDVYERDAAVLLALKSHHPI